MAVTLTPPARARRVPDRHHRGVTRWIVLALVTAAALAMLVPFAFMLLNAFKSPGDYSTNGPLSWPSEFYTKGLRTYWEQVDFPVKLWNSTLIAGSVAVLAVLVSLFNAYALGVGRVRGRLWIIGLFLLANMLPQESLIYPLYHFAKEAGLYNTRLAVIIIFTVIQSAFGTYLLASVLGTFPRTLLEAAALDGAGKWRILWRVVLPNLRPTLSVLLVFFFIWTWNEFLIPLVMLIDNQTQTVPVALASLQGDRLMDAPTTNAGSLLSLVPAILFFLIFQRTLARGITAGAEK
ncbi:MULTISPECIES: carbohydrate ABC transporter permease [Micromonospora]|uniref:Carbohydrate ABC transporter permease n=1 Tax=Micromonospora solifontis TaxID=2487138 RepID=A0ABX9WCI6_9ACTN|nr:MULTISPECIES: carbohydrate ABC transporter permease [Micromonospora]NES14985.1 carbohydrate ABC transporter permease [Micromonospora sp. PPF5-17B]NES39131.1 carbohydrate ABC transporter permease [Micromonospora solifontis]NES57510.1 carbohydrate ABC transporter permease [Micromonospora sp. PPF5-6]RNL90811.1 carbohydrate ABC transporter permease [Micromonospora solifontis]